MTISNRINRLLSFAVIATATLAFTATSADAQLIGVLNQDSAVNASALGGGSQTLSFNAGPIADKLVVQVSSEKDNQPYGVTYNGAPLTLAIAGAGGRSADIWYLDNPFTGGAADITVDFSGVPTVNGVGIGAVSIAGSAADFDVSAGSSADNVTINTTTAGSLVVAGHVSNGTGGVSADSPLNPIYGDSNIGSARGAAGYESGVAIGSPNFSFSGTGSSDVTVATAFAPADDGRVAITDLFNTGVDASGNPLSGDVDDPHYQITDFNNTGPLADSTIPSPPGPWIANDADSRWIGVDNAATNGNAAPGEYTYETTFTIGNDADLSTALITGRWATDNGGVDILLNGDSVGAGQLSPGFGSLTNFIIDASDASFVHGTNTLAFQLNNAGSSPNPTGLRVDDLVGWYRVPEPTSVATWSLIGLGLAGFGYYRTRRKR